MTHYRVELLLKSHDRLSFDCGNCHLNAFLKKNARQQIVKGISRTFVLVDQEQPETILAFSTLVVCEVGSEFLSEKWKKKFPNIIPAAKLARLAVDLKVQKRGFGKILLIDAMQKTVNVSMKMGIVGLFVDAKHEAAKNYYQQFGFLSLPDRLQNMFLPMSSIKKSVSLLS